MLYINEVIQMTYDKVQYRILYLNRPNNEAWLYPLFGKNPLPKFALASDLDHQFEQQKIKVVAGQASQFLATPSVKAIEERDAAYEKIKPLIAEVPRIFIPADRNQLIKERAMEAQCSPNTLMRLLRLYWAEGQTKNALVPAYHKRGSTKTLTSGRGRRPKYEKRDIYQLTEEDIVIFRKVIKSKYLKGVTATIQGTFDVMDSEYYSVVSSEGKRIPKPPGESPSIDQFRRYFKVHFSPEAVIRARDGDKAFELNHAAKVGSAELSVYTAGDNFEIDATIADVYLVFYADRTKIVGKPTIYLIIDSKTWLIVGFYIGFEHPSWPAALDAVVSIGEDKEALCKRYGVKYNPADWPAVGILPKQITADRGSDVISRDSTQLADALEVVVRNLPSKAAKRKPHVECSFKLLQRPLADHIPGYAPPENAYKRQGKHYDQDACLTLDEFTGVMLKAIIKANNSPKPNYPLSPAQTLSGLIPTPINLWNHEIRNRAGALSRYSYEFIRHALLKMEEASVTAEGIYFRNCFYSCPEATKRGWFERARRNAFAVTVSYDRRLVDEILIHDELNPGKTFVATLSEKSSFFQGMSFQEVEAVSFERTCIKKAGEQVTRRQKMMFKSEVDPVVIAAKAETREETKGMSKAARTKNVREDRAAQLAIERQEKARLQPRNEPKTPAEVIPLHAPQPTSAPAAAPNQRNSRLLAMLNGNN